VAADGVHTITPYVNIITFIHSLRHLLSYLYYKCKTKQLITAVRTFWKSKFNKSPCWRVVIMGNGMTLVFIRSIMAVYLIVVLCFRSDRTCSRHSRHNFALFESMVCSLEESCQYLQNLELPTSFLWVGRFKAVKHAFAASTCQVTSIELTSET